MNIYFEYNPYTFKSQFTVSKSKSAQKELEIFVQKKEQEPIQRWVDEVPEMIADLINDDCTIEFKGREADFNDINSAVERFNEKKWRNIKLTVSHNQIVKEEDAFEQLKCLFADIQQGPFDELKEENIVQSFQKVLDREVEVAVVAAASSGKSTVINAMLGKDLMPTRNEATTASITHITHAPQDHYEARPVSKEGNVLEDWKEAHLELMDAYNDDEEVFTTELRGPLRIQSKNGVNIALVDTPGPNNSQDASHRKATFDFIKSKEMPLVLYVLNATQLGIEDDAALLRSLQREMDTSNIQAQERFIFAVNKIDALDPERETVEQILANAKNYLQANGIENPRIFPITAKFAQLLRMSLGGEPLSKRDERHLRDHEYLEEDYQLVEHAMLSEREREEMEREIEEARKSGDEERVSLFYTGMPPLEKAIESYFEKYVFPFKVNAVLSTCKDLLEGHIGEQKVLEELNEKKKENILIRTQYENVRKEISESKEIDESIVWEQQKEIQAEFIERLTDELSRGIAETHMLFDEDRFERTNGGIEATHFNGWVQNFRIVYQDLLFNIQRELEKTLKRLNEHLSSYLSPIREKQVDINLFTRSKEKSTFDDYNPVKFIELETNSVIFFDQIVTQYQEPIIQDLVGIGRKAREILNGVMSMIREELELVFEGRRRELRQRVIESIQLSNRLSESEVAIEQCCENYEWLQQIGRRLEQI